MTRMIRRYSLVAACALLVAGCATQPAQHAQLWPDTPAAIRSVVLATAHGLRDDREVSGHWQGEDANSAFKAYFDGNQLKYVVETAGEGDKDYAVNKYYYLNAQLFYFQGQGSVSSSDALNPRPVDIGVELAFDRDGNVAESVKTVNGQKVRLENGEAASIHSHADELRRQARTLLSQRKP